MQLIDTAADTVRRTVTLTGAWSLKEQTFADGRLSLYNRETGTWKFFTADLEETGFMTTENMDGYFSYDGDTYYYLNDHVLCRKSVADGIQEEVPLNIQLRFLDITAFDGKSGRMALHFYLSPYGSECGTAILNVITGQLDMLQTEYSQTVFTEKGLCLLTFENDAMGYSLRCGSEDKGYYFVDAGIFLDRGNDLYAVPNSPYLIGTGRGSTLYMPGEKIRAWSLADLGLSEDVYFSCFLPEKAVLLMAVFRDGAFHIYAMKPEDISFEELAEGAPIPSPLVVEEALAQSYWQQANGIPVPESLEEARKFADALEQTYGVRILLSSQCREAAALCEYPIALTETMGEKEQLACIQKALEALQRTLALYPEGFLAQFKNSMGEGGLRFLLVSEIRSGFGTIGCTFESRDWQNVALDIRSADGMDGLLCHEIWHATENHILSADYSAFDPEAWAALNPESFTYYETFLWNENDRRQWTLYSGSLEETYFVDGYAQSNAKEDRARIMEYFMTHEDEARLLIQSPCIRQKLQWMSAAVRRCFDTTGWDNVRWEALL